MRFMPLALIPVASLLIAVGGCGPTTGPTEVPEGLGESGGPGVQVRTPSSDRPAELALTVINDGACSAVQNPNASESRRIALKLPSSVGRLAVADAAPRGHLRYVRWNRASKQKVMEVLCVVSLTQEATEAARDFLRAFERPSPTGTHAASAPSLTGGWGDPYMDCLYDPFRDQVECDGVTCDNYATVRSSVQPRAALEQFAASDTYYCQNGCVIYGFAYYWCPGGGGEVGGGESGGGGGGHAEPGYCPNSDPNCLIDLRTQDQARIDSALSVIVDRSRAICREAADIVIDILGRNRLYRGNPNIADAPNDDHDAQSRGGPSPFIHVDTDYLESSTLQGLGGLLLHEGWHLAGYPTHPREDDRPPYATPPWTEQISCANGTYQ